MADSPARQRALAQMLCGAALIGTNGLMVRLADTAPTVSAFHRMLLGGVLLALVLRLRGAWRPLPPRLWAWAALPAVAFAADLWLWHRSIHLVGPGLATVLANAQVFFMALAGMAFYRERIGARFAAGLLLAFGGLWLMLGGEWGRLPAEYRWGVWLGLATGLCYAAYNLALKRAQQAAYRASAGHAPVGQLLAMMSLLCAALLGLAALGEGASLRIPDLATLGWLLALAALGHCLSWVLISRALPYLSVAIGPVNASGMPRMASPWPPGGVAQRSA
ncbi:DMT family transporter [Luteimonas sp. Y-2-2-4F]|nr:EamA family transporter [Luteimonas sp. Y-2-2-4F]MCD9032888.1 DMT family transporter [Luteimonas sp. Y-2-2-4F]